VSTQISPAQVGSQAGSSPKAGLFYREEPYIARRGLHLDLKGVPPTAERLLSLLDLLAAARFNAVLVEWEDMFPWTVDERFRCETAYTKEEVQAFAKKAEQLGIEVIPLVQCLGHMETPLKFPEYAALREVPDEVGGLNPLAPGARDLIRRMIDDVLALLPGVKHFHLGGDEAWSFGTHPDTKAYVEKHGKGALYMHHVEPLLDHLAARGIRPILWHDMMCHWESAALERLATKADLCVWGYQGHPATVATRAHYNIENIKRFNEHGISMWGGSAYKGADGFDKELPVPGKRIENMLAWAEVAHQFAMKGVFVTAWSRYNTMAPQVDPIDAALDLLVMAGAILYDGEVPAAGMAACEEWLAAFSATESARFTACRAVMAELERLKAAAWDHVRLAREHMALAKIDPGRTWANPKQNIKYIQSHIGRLEALLARIKEVYQGLVPPIWLERLVGERLVALQEEVEALRKDVPEK